MTVVACWCGRDFHQTDEGLMCSLGHTEHTAKDSLAEGECEGGFCSAPDGDSASISECQKHWKQRMETTENPLAEGGPAALPGVVPVGVAEASVPDTSRPSGLELALRTVLPPGAFRTSDHRYYWNGKGPVPSVTTILNDVLNKPALITWKSQEVARAIYRDSAGFFGKQWEVGEDAAIGWALKQADKQRDDAAKVGTSVHLLADMQARQCHDYISNGVSCVLQKGHSGPHSVRASESDSKGFGVSEQEKPYLEAFRAFQGFLEARGARIVSSEHMVWSDLGYAGTYDLIVEAPHAMFCKEGDHTAHWQQVSLMTLELCMIDIKTSKGVYPEYALQLVGYGKADRIILEGNPESYPMPKIDRYAVLHLRPDQYPDTGYRLYEYPVTDDDFYRFTSVLDLYLWRKEDKYRKSNLITVT